MNSGVARDPVAIMKTPFFASPSTAAIARISSSPAMVEGMGSPPWPLWLGENEDAKPIAPAAMAARTSTHNFSSCAGDGSRSVEAASPITAVRMVECCANTPTFA